MTEWFLGRPRFLAVTNLIPRTAGGRMWVKLVKMGTRREELVGLCWGSDNS